MYTSHYYLKRQALKNTMNEGVSKMQCKCGGELNDSTHVVTTLDKAQEWDSSLTEADIPVMIHNASCVCGRRYSRVDDRRLYDGEWLLPEMREGRMI